MVTNKQQVINLLKDNSDKLKKFGIKQVGIFGSFVYGTPTRKSDVDLLVKFNKGQKSFRNFMNAAEFTKDLLGRNVDFITPESLSPYLAPHIEKEVEYVQIS